jgi:hypothetical protein
VAPVTIVIGLLLIALGLGGYFGTDQVSLTALIPAYFGAPLLLLGLLGLNDKLRKHAMHAAVAVGLLGFLGAIFPLAMRLISGKPFELRTAAAMQLIMAALCLLLVALGVRSFIAARRRRQQQTSPGQAPGAIDAP